MFHEVGGGRRLSPSQEQTRTRVDAEEAGLRRIPHSKCARRLRRQDLSRSPAFVLITLIVTKWMPRISTGQIIFFVILAAGIGVFLPNFVLEHLAHADGSETCETRFPTRSIFSSFASKRAFGFHRRDPASCGRVALQPSELASELALVNAETRAGVEREAALRTTPRAPASTTFAASLSLLIQTLRFGTSVADTLRVYSEEFRDRRMQKSRRNGSARSARS